MSAAVLVAFAGLVAVYVGTGIGLLHGWELPQAFMASLGVAAVVMGIALLVTA